jgi:iron complex transport system substrate-binding protein
VRSVFPRLVFLCVLLLSACGGTAATTGATAGTATTVSISATLTTAATSSSPGPATTTPAGSTATATTASAAPPTAQSAATASAATTQATTTTTALTAQTSATSSSVATTAVSSSGAATAGSSLAGATNYPLTVKDDQGTAVTLPAKPTHIVSLVPSNTEILYAVGAGDDLVAGTQYDDYPPAAKAKALIKGLKPSLEVVTAYHPDLVLATPSNAADLIQQLRTLHIPVVFLDAHDFAGVYHDIELVGQIVDAAPAAQRVVAGMEQQVRAVTAKVTPATARPRVFVELDASDPTKIFTVGPGSFIDTMVTLAGGTNVAHDAKSEYPQLGLEALVAADPQIIILNDAAYGASAATVAQRPGWTSLSAVKDHRIYPIDDALVSRPGPRLADGLMAIARLIHPELFS